MKSRALHDALTTGASASPEHRALMRAVAKADGDRALAIRNVCRLYTVKTLDALPAHVRLAVHDALP